MDQVKNVLAAVGQFPQDDLVLARAAQITRAHKVKLTIVHVIDTLTGFNFVSVDLRRIQNQMRHDAREKIIAAVARQGIGDDEIDIRIETGSPSLRLIELMDEINVDLIVMRAHESESILEKIIGSTTDRVIRAGCAPVLVVKRPVKQAYQCVVVAIDAQVDASAVVAFVAALLPLARLQLTHVVQIPSQFKEVLLRVGTGQPGIDAHRDALIRKAKTYLDDITERLSNRATRSTMRIIDGDPAQVLARATWSAKVDLILLGPGSSGGIRQALLGSVTQQVLRTAACDVLICRPDQ